MGAGASLVGVSEYSDFPEAAQAIPRVGGLEVSAERVASLHPDLVLASQDGNARGPVMALESAGIPVLAVSGALSTRCSTGIRIVAARLGRARQGGASPRSLARRRAAVRRRAPGRRGRRALLLVWPDPPQAAGRGTFLDDVLREAGAENVLGGRAGWPTVSAEFLATERVDILVIPESGPTRAYAACVCHGPSRAGRIAKARVVRLPESPLTRPGPRVFDVLERLERARAGGR